MYLRHCEGDIGAFRLVIRCRKIIGASDALYERRPGGSYVSVTVSPFAPPGAAVGVAMGGWFMV